MSSSVDESSVAADGASSDAGAEKGGKSKKKIRFPPGFKLIRLLKRMEKQVETNPRPDYLAKIAELKENIQRKRDEKRRHVAKKMLKKQRVFLLRSFIKKVKEFRYKIENAAADLPENVLTERKRMLQKYTEELEIVKALDLDTLVTEAMDAVENKPAEPTTREDRVKHRLILNPDVQKYLRYKPGNSDASAMTAEDLDTDSASEDSQGRGKKRRSKADAADDDDNDPFFGSGNKAEEADEADPEKEVAYARQSLFLDSLAQKPKKKTVKKKKEPYKPKNRPGQRARQAMREGTNPARSGPGGPRPPFRSNKDGGGSGGAYARPDKARADKPRSAEERSNLPSKISKPPRPASKPYAAAAAEKGSLHPSWEAKRQAELQRQVTSFQGTKIKFDD